MKAWVRIYISVVGVLFCFCLKAECAPACGPAALPSCADLSNTPVDASKTYGPVKDGGVLFNGQAYWLTRNNTGPRDAYLASMQTVYPPRVTRAREIAETLKKKAADYLRSQMPDSAERRDLIARFEGVIVDTSTQPYETCGDVAVPNGFPNAGYREEDKTLYICTPATNLTESQLTHLIIHELGHVAAPCVTRSSDVFAETKACIYREVKPSFAKLPAYLVARAVGKSDKQALALLQKTHGDICSDAFDEAFADRFSTGLMGHVSAAWSASDLRNSLLGETGFTCFENVNLLTRSRYEIPSVRLQAMLNDDKLAALMGCDRPKDKHLCPLQFTLKGAAAPTSSKKPAIR